MLRTCPRCGDFYADDSLLFCLADGTPLAEVDPHGDTWAEGTRVVKEKGRVLRRLTRRLRLRRILMMTTTVLITTTVVFVVAVNTYVYFTPQPDAPVVAAALTPSPSPTPSETPSPTPTPTPTPTPSCTARDRQRVIDAIEARQKAEWRTAIEGERDAIKRAHVPDGAISPSVTLLKPTYAFKFSKTCAPLSVTVSYSWQVKWADSLRMPGGEKTVSGTKTFACKKDGAAWRCG
jgi:hypothetical protein